MMSGHIRCLSKLIKYWPSDPAAASILSRCHGWDLSGAVTAASEAGTDTINA
jgi:hypothetical protein